MVTVRSINPSEKDVINEIVTIHIKTFKDFFLSSMDCAFIRKMYQTYCVHNDSDLLMAFDDEQPVGFLAYSMNMSNLYKYMLTRHLFFFGWYGFRAFLRKPSSFFKLIGALGKPSEAKRDNRYVKISSIGVLPAKKSNGIGSRLVSEMIKRVDFSEYDYIALETDAENNDAVNAFYQKNGFVLDHVFVTREDRVMNEYRYTP